MAACFADTAARAPAKDVIILIDMSGSMGEKYHEAILTAKHFIQRLSVADSFAIFAYGTRTVKLFPESGSLAQGTAGNTGDAIGALYAQVSHGLQLQSLWRTPTEAVS